MRRARLFPMLVVGLASFTSQTMVLPECRGWDYVPESAQSDMLNAPSTEGVIIDSSVEQAGYYDSRPRPNATMSGMAVKSAPPVDSNGALYRGQKLKMPTLPFGRPAAQNQAAQRVPQSSPSQLSAPAAAPWGAPSAKSRTPQSASAVSKQMPQRMAAGMPNGMPANHPAVRATAAHPAQPMPKAGTPRVASAPRSVSQLAAPNAAPRSMPNTSPTSPASPWNKAPQAHPTTKSAAPAAPKQAALESPTDRIVAEAHSLSTSAQTEADYTQVIATCRRALASEASPEATQFAQKLIAWSLNRRGQLKAEAGHDKEAILDFDEAIHTDASCWRALHNRGVLLAQAGQFEKAFDDFSRTIQLNQNYAKAYSNRAALFMVADNLDAALVDYKQSIKLDSNLAVAHRGCGRVCQLLGKVDESVAHYDAAVQLAPDDSYAAACRADLLTDLGRYDEAVAEYDRALQIDPQSSQAQSGLAWLLATCPDSSIRNPAIAIEQAKAVIKNGGQNDPVNYDTLAAAQASAGDFAAAMDSVRHAIQLAPADERDSYKDRLNLYQKAKPYRIAPVERVAQQVSYETTN